MSGRSEAPSSARLPARSSRRKGSELVRSVDGWDADLTPRFAPTVGEGSPNSTQKKKKKTVWNVKVQPSDNVQGVDRRVCQEEREGGGPKEGGGYEPSGMDKR